MNPAPTGRDKALIAPVFRGLALLAAVAASAPALAQQKDAQDESQIVVTGAKDRDKAIRDFVGALAQAPVHGQLSRFEAVVCPFALGLSASQNAIVAHRIRLIAKEVGIIVGGEHCTPNVIVLVTPDKRALIEALAKHRDDYFGDMAPWQITRLAREPGPATAWQLPDVEISARGTPVEVDPGTGLPTNRTTEPATRGTAPTRPQFLAAIVVIDANALAGLTPVQLADYAAMRTLANTDPSKLGDSTAPTILKVLEAPMGSETPASLTSWDLGYLRGLYAHSDNLYAGAQRSAIRRQITKESDREAKP